MEYICGRFLSRVHVRGECDGESETCLMFILIQYSQICPKQPWSEDADVVLLVRYVISSEQAVFSAGSIDNSNL